jgi:hypothetical protein
MPCERFETEGLLALERGDTLEPHFDTCPDCLEARAAYARLEAQLVEAGRAWVPPPDWEARVFARVAQTESAPRRSLWRWLVPALGLASAVVVGLVLMRSGPGGAGVGPPVVELGVERGTQQMRGDAPRPGDTLVLRARVENGETAAVRVYRNDRTLVFACHDEPGCERTRGDEADEVLVRVSLAAPGEYRALVVVGFEGPAIDPPLAVLDQEFERVRKLGRHVQTPPPVRVE